MLCPKFVGTSEPSHSPFQTALVMLLIIASKTLGGLQVAFFCRFTLDEESVSSSDDSGDDNMLQYALKKSLEDVALLQDVGETATEWFVSVALFKYMYVVRSHRVVNNAL